jgi:hypothetical protein
MVAGPAYRYYLMAFILSILFALAAFFVLSTIDGGQVNELAKQVEQDTLDAESARLSLLFIDSLSAADQAEACRALEENANQQVNRTYGLFTALEQAKTTLFFGDLDTLRDKYFLSNASLYLNFKQLNRQCTSNNDLVLYFYQADAPCPDCWVQGTVLDELRNECPAVKTFAFPTESRLPFVQLLKKTFGVEETPTLVVNEEQVFPGLTAKEQLKTIVAC